MDEDRRSTTSFSCEQTPSFGDGLTPLSEGNAFHDLIEHQLLDGLGPEFVGHAEILGIYQKELGNRLQVFNLFVKAIEEEHGGGDFAQRFAWYACSAEDARKILEHGFGAGELEDGIYGYGVYLTADEAPLECYSNSVPDGDGRRVLLLCRVFLGNTEVGFRGQIHPTSKEFDTGVDDLTEPKKLIVWSTRMNTHILPEFLVSFRCISLPEYVSLQQEDWMGPSRLRLEDFYPPAHQV